MLVIALRNLRRNRVRSLLTLFGVAVGIAVFVALTSISSRVKAGLRSVVAAYEGDVVVQSIRAATPPGSRIPVGQLASLAALEGVEAATPVVVGSVKTPWSPYFLVFGIPEAFTGRLSLTRGRGFRDGASELLLGEEARRVLGVGVGAAVVLAGREFTLVGTYATGAPLVDGAAVTGVGELQGVFDQPGFVNLVLLHLRPGAHPRQVIEAVQHGFPRLRAGRGPDLIGQTQLFRTVDMFAGAVSLVALLAACLVASTTLLMAVSERTREIGILMAVGWSRTRIVGSLMTEALLLCAAAGVVGNALAVFFLRSLANSGTTGLGWVPVRVPSPVLWASLGISCVVGLASGLYPAVITFALSPAEALRQE